MNRHLSEHLPSGMFVTLLAGIFAPEGGQLSYVNAGHPLPMIIGHGDVCEWGVPRNPPLGFAEAVFQKESTTLEADCGLVVITDGFTETTSADGSMLGGGGIVAAMRELTGGPSQAVASAIARAADRFRDSLPQQDDATVLVLRNAGKA